VLGGRVVGVREIVGKQKLNSRLDGSSHQT
jgi:hypothetical protein